MVTHYAELLEQGHVVHGNVENVVPVASNVEEESSGNGNLEQWILDSAISLLSAGLCKFVKFEK